MLTNAHLESLYSRLNLPEPARKVIEQIRSCEPLRRVGGGSRNVCGSYASQKMGWTIQFESHTVELAAIELFYEYDDDVLEYWDQAFQFTLKYKSNSGKNITCTHIPDFFVLRKNSVGFEEWKPEKTLEKLAVKQSNRYRYGEDNLWHSPPASEYVCRFGVYYRLRSNNEIDWIKYRNIKYLKDYLDKKYIVNKEISTTVIAVVASNPGITLAQLLKEASATTVDDINALIAAKKIYIDLSTAPLIEQERVHIFRDQSTAKAYSIVVHSRNQMIAEVAGVVDVRVGSSIFWDGLSFIINAIGETQIWLRGEDGLIGLTYAEFDKLVQLGDIKGLSCEQHSSISSLGWEYFLKASPEALSEANRRYQAITPYLCGQPPEEETVSFRTLRDWKAKYFKAKQKYGCGLIGLIDNRQAKGNRTPRYSDKAIEFIDNIIEQHYETFKQKNGWAVYSVLKSSWNSADFIEPIPSYETFRKRLKERSGYKQTKNRLGQRAANQKLPPYLELFERTPRHGDRPFEMVHIDHTLLDLEIVCSYTGINLGRPWVTAMIDAYSRRILAAYITFDPPSYRSCMMVLRICVSRFGRFPETIMVDNGKEFKSVYFDTLLARFECTKKHRPPNLPKFSSIIERWFGTNNTQFINNLRGNTQITKHVRLVNSENNPKNLAVWTLDEFYEKFASGYCYGVYDQSQHPALVGLSPRETFVAGLARSGSRPHLIVEYDEQFRILTLPSTQKGIAKVQPGTGVRINYLDYWSTDDSFLRPDIEGKQVPVRYDPFDWGTAYAYVGGQWVRCISKQYGKFQGCSERMVMLATTILRQKRKLHGKSTQCDASDIAVLLQNAEQHEELLLQRLRDRAASDVRDLIEGKSVVTKRDKHNTSNGALKDTPLSDFTFNEPELKQTIDLNDIKPYNNEELWK